MYLYVYVATGDPWSDGTVSGSYSCRCPRPCGHHPAMEETEGPKFRPVLSRHCQECMTTVCQGPILQRLQSHYYRGHCGCVFIACLLQLPVEQTMGF